MSQPPFSKRNRALRMMAFIPPALLLMAPLYGQQTYVTRYDAFVGYNFLNSSKIDLFEPGIGAQVGFRPRTWYSFGFDFTAGTGDLTLRPGLLPTALQQQLAASLGALAAHGLLPPGYNLAVKTHSNTMTFALGPQLAYRHFKKATLFFRPVYMGAIREVATPKPEDPIAKAIVQQLSPSGEKHDVTWFIGFGGGFDIILSNHFSIRAQGDYVWDHLFNDLLREGRMTTRFSVGPAFSFGPNIVKKQ